MTKYSAILLLLLSSGCGSFDKPKVVVQQEPVYLRIVCPVQPNPAPIAPRKVRPQVIEDTVGIFWVGLTPQDYENLAINTQETIRYIKGQRGLTDYYLDCITKFNSHIERLEAED